jgi:YD repeat-containing protein
MVAIFTGAGTGLERGSGNVLGSSGLLGSAGFGRSGSQVFLNAANGNLVINRQDEFLVGRGPDAGVARTYNSLGSGTDDNGDNWRQSTQRAVRLNGTANSWGSSVTHRMGDGTEVNYYWGGSSYVVSGGAGVHDKIVIDGAVLRWTDGDTGIVETYENDGVTEWRRLKTVADTSGNAVTYGYTGDKLTSITTANGEQITYSWTGNHITQVNSGDGTLTRYFYDGYDRLNRVDVELTSGGSVYSTSYTYHGSSKLVATISETVGSSDSIAFVSIAYDGDNRVTSLTQTVSSGVTRTTSIVYGEGYASITDPAGQVTTLHYDWTGALTQITAPPASTGAAQQTVNFGYNEDGDLSSVTDALGQFTIYTRDSWGRVVSQTDRLDNTTLRTFNASHKVLTETRLGIGTTRYVYDSLDRLVYVVTPEGRVTRNWYDTAGQLYFINDFPDYLYDLSGFAADETPTQVQLEAWCTSLPESASSQVTQIVYDARGNVTRRLGGSQNDGYAWLNLTGGHTDERFTYDAAGQLLERYIVGQNHETFIYDGLGRITASTDLNGGTTSFVFNDAALQTVVTLASGFVQTSVYNKAGELVSFTESGSGVAGGTASYQYDSLGRLRVMTDASGLKTYYVYDKAGRKVAEAHGSGTFTEYRYDANNRVVASIRYGLGNSGAQVPLLQDPNSTATIDTLRPVAHPYDLWTWNVYDKEGRVVEAIEGDGSVTTYAYDAAGRLVETKGFVNKLTSAQIATFKTTAPASMVLPAAHAKDGVARIFYDKDGYAIGALDGEGYLTRTIYDKAGRKVQEIAYATATNPAYRASGSLQNLIDSVGTSAADRSTRYVYDGQGLLRFTIDGLNRVTEFGYGGGAEAVGLVRQTIQYAGTLGALSSYTYASVKSAVAALASNPANRTSWAVYDVAGRMAYSIDATGAVIGYGYDNRGQVTRKVEYATLRATPSLPSKAEMDSWAGTPTASDRVTRYYYNARGEQRFTVDAEGYVTRTDYDAEGRVAYSARWNQPVTATDSSTLSSVSASVTGIYAATSWTYDDAGRLFTITDPEGTLRRYYYYGNGKLAHEYVAPGEADQSRTTFTYDQAGRLAVRYDAYTATEEAITQYSYDGLGNLVGTIDANSHATSWTYDKLGRKLSETNSAGGVTTYEYNAFDEVVRTIDARGNSSWRYYDKLGRVVATRDAEDYVTESSYTAFGELASVTRRANKAINGASVSTLPVYPLGGADAVTQFTYDKLGRILTTIDAQNAVETNWYDAFGGVIKTQNKLGGITEYNRNLRGLVIRELVHAPVYDAAGNQTAPTYYRNKFEYDARGNLVHQIEAHGLPEQRDTFFYYDKADRLILKEGTALAVGQSGGAVTPYERYKYDKRGNLVETWDAAGGHAWYYYDDLDRKVAEIVAVTATTGAYKAYGYDDVGNLTSSRAYDGWASLPTSAGGTPPAPPAGGYRETSYTYDNINRLLTSSVAGQAIGYQQNGSYVYTTGTLTASYQYDATGNVVKTTDPAGAVVYSYYDKLGRKTAQVDALSYATTWTLDAEGNVTSERRYATQASGIGTGGYSASTSASDRVTEFEYDKMGRRLKEKRLGVEAWSLNTSNGQIDSATGTSIVQYSYNALGQVTQKIEATGEATSYSYDSAGRLTAEHRASFVDFLGGTVTPSVRYYYNSLEDLVRTEQGGSSASSADRVTMNLYGAGGRLLSTTDAAGYVRSYIYDAAGRKTGEYYTRDLGRNLAAPGGLVTEGLAFEYDRAGNLTRQSVNTITSGTWSEISYTKSAYNAHGEVTDRGVNGWQEQFAYDGAGRLIRSNAGDGIWRHYVYDAAGRQTLVIESEGMDLSGMSQATAMSWASSDGVNTTVTRYDARGQVLETIQRLRETGVGSARQDIVIDRDYNAFGEMVREEDAYNRRTDYSYNSMGRVTQIQRPTVTVTSENGTQSTVRPTEKFFYDISGRLIGTQDANSVAAGASYKTTRQLLAGTGYGDGEAIVVKEWHPDGGTPVSKYDVFGDLRTATDEVGRTTWMNYDKLGRLLQQTDPESRTQYYAYDLLGNRTGHWNNVVGYAGRERTEYDALGRVTLQVGYGDDTVGRDTITTSYAWETGLATSGLGTFGGWLATTTYVNGLYSQERTDMFGRETWKRDLGGHVTTTAYDLAGRIASKTVTDPASGATDTISYTWLNTGQVGQVTIGVDTSASQGNFTQDRTSYTYDLVGNRLTEIFTRLTGAMVDHGYWEYDYSYGYPDQYWVSDWQYETSLVTISSQSASYDELGRLTYWSAAATSTTPAASTNYYYDANSNIRRSVASFNWLDQNGTAYYPGSQDYWYRYDSMNRVVTAKGIQTGSGIVRGGQGLDLTYDAAGQRTQALSTVTAWGQVYVEVYDPNMYGGWGGYTWQYQDVSYEADNREDYTYWGDGQLKDVRVARSGYTDNGDGTITVTAPPATGLRKADYWYDTQGRLERQIDWGAADPDVHGNGAVGSALYDRSLTYNAKGQVTFERLFQRQGGITQTNDTTSLYGSGSSYALGAVVSVTTQAWRSDVPYSTSTTNNTYKWYDGAALASTTVSGTTSGTTTYNYNSFGQLVSAWISDGRSRSIFFTNDANGQAIRRDEQDYVGQGDPHEVWYRFAGREMGYTGNNGTLETDYTSSVASRPLTPGNGAFRGGATYGQIHADFDQFYNPVTSYEQGGAGGSYTVQGGESLSSIAAQLWGDSNLWYRLAEANGLSAGSALAEGHRLTIPAGVMRSTYNASTFAPYDPSAILGDTSPTTPTPQAPRKAKGNNCGVFGAILLAVVAIAITAVIKVPVTNFFSGLFGTTAAAAGSAGAIATGVAAGATIGAAASAGSQLFGLATGIQDKFSWKGVALAGISGGIGGGLAKVPGLDKIAGSSFLGDVAQGVLGNAIGQGIGVATGLQSKFDFAGVAAAGAAAGAANAMGSLIGSPTTRAGAFGARVAVRTASALAGAATRSVLSGTSFGDNIIAVLPDVIAQTLGDVFTDVIARSNGSGIALEGSGARSGDTSHAAENEVGGEIDALQARYGSTIAPGSPAVDDGYGEIVVTARRGGGASAYSSLPGGTVTFEPAKEPEKLEAYPVTIVGHAVTRRELDKRWYVYSSNRMDAHLRGERYDPASDLQTLLGFQENYRLVSKWEAIAAPALLQTDLVFGAFITPWLAVPAMAEGAALVAGGSLLNTFAGTALFVSGANHTASSISAPWRGTGQTLMAQGVDQLAPGWGNGVSLTVDFAGPGALITNGGINAARGFLNSRAAEGATPEIKVLFGQKRVGPTFGVEGRPDYLAGRTITDVAVDLRSGVLHPDQLPIDAFRYGDDLVSANTRSLSALSEAGLRPTVINEIQPTNALLRRLRETPIVSNAPLPGPRVPVTPSQSNLDVLRIIELAK